MAYIICRWEFPKNCEGVDADVSVGDKLPLGYSLNMVK